MTTYNVTIADGGVAVRQMIQAESIEAAVSAIEAQMRSAESAYNAEDQRHEWDGAIIDGTALYRLHDGGQDSTGCARATIEAAKTTNIYGKPLTEQGIRIVAAIELGISRMTPERWMEEAEKAAQYEDEGEWFAPEFAEAREATQGISWDFDGWANALDCIGKGKIGGVSLLRVRAEREKTIDA